MAEYNNIYELLVKDEGDMVGRIAYSLYKEEKIEWIKKFRMDNRRRPKDEEIETQFHVAQRQEGCRKRYLLQAENLLRAFTNSTLRQVTSQIEDECRADILGKLAEKESMPKRYLHGIMQSILGSVILAFLIWLLIAVVGHFSIGDLQIEFKKRPAEAVLAPSGV